MRTFEIVKELAQYQWERKAVLYILARALRDQIRRDYRRKRREFLRQFRGRPVRVR